MKKNPIKIFIAAHKECILPKNDIYIPLHVGAKDKKNLGYIKDSTKDNISDKNKNYCELTGVYWIWKNINANIVGLVHYRRYFFSNVFDHTLDKIISCQEIEEILKKKDVIVSKKIKIPKYTVKKQYEVMHYINDYDKCRNIIEQKYPDYLESFDKISKRRYLYAYNMCIMKKELFNNYCIWLFDILFQLEKEIDISNYSTYDKRVFGFLSERLFNVWLEKNKLKLEELYVYNVDDKFIKQLMINIVKNIFIRG